MTPALYSSAANAVSAQVSFPARVFVISSSSGFRQPQSMDAVGGVLYLSQGFRPVWNQISGAINATLTIPKIA